MLKMTNYTRTGLAVETMTMQDVEDTGRRGCWHTWSMTGLTKCLHCGEMLEKNWSVGAGCLAGTEWHEYEEANFGEQKVPFSSSMHLTGPQQRKRHVRGCQRI